jgi:hypothetical protein
MEKLIEEAKQASHKDQLIGTYFETRADLELHLALRESKEAEPEFTALKNDVLLAVESRKESLAKEAEKKVQEILQNLEAVKQELQEKCKKMTSSQIAEFLKGRAWEKDFDDVVGEVRSWEFGEVWNRLTPIKEEFAKWAFKRQWGTQMAQDLGPVGPALRQGLEGVEAWRP